MKKTKKVVVGSLATIAVSCALIGGATLAYFTDEASTNIAITAGNVEIVATVDENSLALSSMGEVMTGNTFANGGKVEYKEGALEIARITPGDKLEFDIVVENKSDISIKYQTQLTANNALLLSGLDVVVAGDALQKGSTVVTSDWSEIVEAKGEVGPIHVEIELPKEAGNEYKLQSCTLNVAVNAIQANGEAVSDAKSLKDAIANGDTFISLTGDVDVTGAGDSARPADGLQIAPDSEITIDGNGHVIVLDHTAFNYWNGNEGVLSGTLIFKNIHFKASNPGQGYALTLGFDSTATVSFENCTFDDMYTAIICNANTIEGGASVKIEGCKYINTRWGYSLSPADGGNKVAVTFVGNTTDAKFIAEQEDFNTTVVESDSVDSIQDAINCGAEKIVINLTDDIALDSHFEIQDGTTELIIDGNNNIITLDQSAFNNKQGLEGVSSGKLVFKNIHFVGTNPATGFALVLGFQSTAEVVFDNCTFDTMWSAVYCNNNVSGSASVTIINCTYINTKYGYSVELDPTTGSSNVSVVFEGNDTTGITGSESEF